MSGAVNKEDVYELKEGSRISEAIEKAGGLREDACIEDINLAYKLEDGMKIYIPTKQEKETENAKKSVDLSDINDSSNANGKENIYISSSSGVKENEKDLLKNDGKKVNINTATQTELETLPGVGPSTARKIIEYRKEKGKFNKIEEIKEVSGIGSSKYEKIKNYITN